MRLFLRGEGRNNDLYPELNRFYIFTRGVNYYTFNQIERGEGRNDKS